MSYPLSILIPTYNRRYLLEEALRSIFEQSLASKVEIVVVDDGSEDNTWDYLNFFKEEHNNLKIFKHPKNLGVSAARNSALSFSTGSYIMFLDSDDYLLPGALERIFQSLKEEREVYLCSVLLEKGKRRKEKVFPEPPLDPLLRLKSFLEGKYSEAIYIIKSNLIRTFTFNPSLKVREDFVFKGYLFASYHPKIIKEPCVVVRDHPKRLRYLPEYYESSVLLSVESLFQILPHTFHSLYSYALAKA
ncbi:MAG: glycosyltransferase family 2 protein, partial [Caldimicrobium sp.]